MKNEACPNCGGMLGVPDKLRGLPVECPVCRLEFVPGSGGKTRTKKSGSKKSTKPAKPLIRAVPLPATLSTEPGATKAKKVKYVGAKQEHLMPSGKPRLNTLTPEPIPRNRGIDQVAPDSDQTNLFVQRRPKHEPDQERSESKKTGADPINTGRLFTTLPGQIMLSIAVILDVSAWLWARAILTPDI